MVKQVLCVFGSPPSLGVGRVARLDDAGAVGTDRERRYLCPEGRFYPDLARHCCQAQVTPHATWPGAAARHR